MVFIFILFLVNILYDADSTIPNSALLQLGRVTGGAFAFIFSIGLYLVRKSENTSQRGMPLFNNKLLIFCLFFAMSIMLPFTIHSSKLQGVKLSFGIVASYALSFICLSFIPFVYESIQNRYEPRQVLIFLRNKAIKNMEKTENYTETWKDILDIDRICRAIYDTDIDVFASGIRYLVAILKKGIESYNKRKKIILNNKSIPVEEWIRLISTRIIWIGEKVVSNRLAFERIIVEVIYHLQKMPEVIFTICFTLLKYAKENEENESLEIGLYYFIPWCKENDLYERCKVLEPAIF